MTAKSVWKKILPIVILVLFLTFSILLIIYYSSKNTDTGLKNIATVSVGPLSSNLSSNGVIQKIGTDMDIPLAVAVNDEEELGKEQSSYPLIQAILNSSKGEIFIYKVVSVNEKFQDSKTKISSSDPSEDILTLRPVTINFEEANKKKNEAHTLNETSAESLYEYFVDQNTGMLIAANLMGTDILTELPDEDVVITTGDLTSRIKDKMNHITDFSYTVSDIFCLENDYLKIDDTLMHIAYEEWFTVFSLSEYDVAPINERMRNGEKVYASVGINALNANKVVAEISEIKTGSNVSGVSYFSLYGRLIFPKIETDAEGNEIGNYAYYSEELDEPTVENLGVDIHKNVQKEELLSNYSVTITAQKSVVYDQLIVPTKCIYYNDANEPYVKYVDEDNKEYPVYIEIVLSTGKEAAVKPKDGYRLKQGDPIRYTAEDSLLSSIF